MSCEFILMPFPFKRYAKRENIRYCRYLQQLKLARFVLQYFVKRI